ncbi:hypothetical protein [Brevundimonas sp.]
MSATITPALFATLALLVGSQSSEEPQWISGRIQDRDPVAAFLSWDFSSVILRATCHGEAIVITYYGDGVTPHDAPQTILIVDEASFDTRRVGPAAYEIDPAGVAALRSGEWVEFDAPNEMGEAWYLGRADALKRLAATCSDGEQ